MTDSGAPESVSTWWVTRDVETLGLLRKRFDVVGENYFKTQNANRKKVQKTHTVETFLVVFQIHETFRRRGFFAHRVKDIHLPSSSSSSSSTQAHAY